MFPRQVSKSRLIVIITCLKFKYYHKLSTSVFAVKHTITICTYEKLKDAIKNILKWNFNSFNWIDIDENTKREITVISQFNLVERTVQVNTSVN